MKKVLLSIFAIGFIIAGACAQNVTIPDANFKAYLVGNTAINTNMDTEIQVSEASAFTGQMLCQSQNISDLTGIEAFTSLTDLRCFDNSISSIDVSNNPGLVYFNCQDNLLTSLDVSNNPSLGYFNCFNNSIIDLDVSNNPALIMFQCYNNALTSLNLGNGANTSLSIFDATINPNLTCIDVDDDVYSLANWSNIDAQTSYSTDCSACLVNIPNASFKAQLVGNSAINSNSDTQIQCSEAIAFTGTINCAGFGITDLTGIEAFTSLTSLDCWGNPLLTLDLSQNTSLVNLNCDNCSLTALNVSNNPLLTYLNCSQNQFTSIDVTQNVALDTLMCAQGFVNTLDVSQNTALTFLNCNAQNLSTLDVSLNTNLKQLYCDDNSLLALDVTTNSSLWILWCKNNALTELNAANGNNTNMSITNYFFTTGNPNLTCIQVDDAVWSTTNWTNIDATSSFSEDCSSAGINDLKVTTMNVYPNPASSLITIDTKEQIESVLIFDLFGSLVKHESTTSFSIEELSSGVYIAHVRTNTGISRIRFVKK